MVGFTRVLAILMGLVTHGVPAAATPEAAVACAACEFVRSQGGLNATSAASALCARAAGAFAALGQSRDRFRLAPRYTELFATVYWHVTRLELQRIADGAYRHPLEVLRQIDFFFDAYAWNRARFAAGLPPETHWLDHFTEAAEADLTFGQIGRGMAFDTPSAVDSVLMSGVMAHIDFDLPRALRAAFFARLDRSLDPSTLSHDFVLASGIFAETASAVVNDITTAVSLTSDWEPQLRRPEMMNWFQEVLVRRHDEVLEQRSRAWAIAFEGRPLPTRDAPHPPVGERIQVDCPGRPSD